LGAQPRRRGLRDAHPVRGAWRVHDQVRVAPLARGTLGLPLLRRHRGPSRRRQRRRGAGGGGPHRRLPQGAGLVPDGGAVKNAAHGRTLDATQPAFAIEELAPAHVRAIAPYVPGKPIAETARELGIPEADILKMASNENPLGPSPRALEAMRGALAELHYYPDGSGYDLKAVIARKLGVEPAMLVLG